MTEQEKTEMGKTYFYKGYQIEVKNSFTERGVVVGVISKDNVRYYIERKASKTTHKLQYTYANLFGEKSKVTEHTTFDEMEAKQDLYKELVSIVDAIEFFVEYRCASNKPHLYHP